VLLVDAAVLLGLAFSLFWAGTSFNTYFFSSVEHGVSEFKKVVLPSDAHPSVLEGFANTAVVHFFGDGHRRTGILIHIAVGAVLAALFAFQVSRSEAL
jgi:hypothetical protein